MKKESDAILLRIFIGESTMYHGKHLYKYLMGTLIDSTIASI